MFEISRSRKTRVDVVVPEQGKRKLSHIAAELIRCLKAAAGGQYRVAAEPSSRTVRVIELAIDPDLKPRRRAGEPEPINVVAWKCDGRRTLTLSGNSVESLWLSAYAFLEEVVGCRWFFPGELGEDIPVLKRLRLAKMNVVKTPSFIARDFRWWPKDFQRKKLAGGFVFKGCHSYSQVIPPKVAKKHPEYFSLIDGKRSAEVTQLCVSHPDVEDYALEFCLKEIRNDPETHTVALSANDTNRFCNCLKCTETNLGRKLRKGERPSIPKWITRSIFEFSNRVARRFEAHHPDKWLTVLAYARTKEPPKKLKVHDRILVWYCNQPQANWCGPAGRATMENDLEGWSRVAKHIGIYDYLLNQAWPGFPRTITRLLGRYMKLFHRKGVRYYYTQCGSDFGVSLPNYYLAAALCWDVTRDPRKVLDDMYARCFPSCGQAVKRYFEIMEKAIARELAKDPGPGALGAAGSRNSHEQMAVIYTPEVLAEAQQALDEARKTARGRVEKARLKLICDGFEFTKLGIEAARKTFEFQIAYSLLCLSPFPWRSTAGNYDYHSAVIKLEAYGEPCIERFQQLRSLWRQYARMRKRLEKTNVLMTGKYAHGGTFFPLEILDNIWKLYTGELDRIPYVNIARKNLRVM